MVVETQAKVREAIKEWLEEARKETGDLRLAAQAVAQRVVKEGRASEFVQEFGPAVIADGFQSENRQARVNGFAPGERRVNPAHLKESDSLLECFYYVGDKQVRLGDMDKAMCQQEKTWFEKQAAGNMKEARFFGRLTKALKKGQTVEGR
jgi:hypothetical protein